ncbi:fungal hydrophobin-domain-containing protein [Infundibulicybe gibba]|nr:fungal hydrophobin-domain-containing protein [Infundibulicybe gibba]
MKFTTCFAVLAAAAATVGAVPAADTNAQRLARGLPLLPPVRRATPVGAARRGSPSGTPGGTQGGGQCNTGSMQCCNSTKRADNPVAKLLLGLLKIDVAADLLIGLTCSPLSVVGLNSNSCSQQPVCCQNNNFNGLVALGCSPKNLIWVSPGFSTDVIGWVILPTLPSIYATLRTRPHAIAS